MARTDNLNNFLTDVADAIRDKKGTTDEIKASKFDTEISSIEAGVDINEYFGGTAGYKQNYIESSILQAITKVPAIKIKGDSMRQVYYNLRNVTEIDLSSIDTRLITSWEAAFYFCTKLASLDLSNFDTSNVTNMRLMFSECRRLTSLDLSNFDTSNVTDMSSMFQGCSNLTSLDLSNFDTSNVTNMTSMFQGNSKLASLDLSNFDTSNVTNMTSMFQGNSKLASLELSNFDTSNVTNMSSMFRGCSNLTSLDLSNFDTSNVTDMSSMFQGNSKLASLELSNFDTSNVTNMTSMFQGTRISLINLTNADFSKVAIIMSFQPSIYYELKLNNHHNLGKGYLTSAQANYSNYKFDISNATNTEHDGLLDIINGLYDIKTKGCNVQSIVLGSTNLAKLTAEEIAIATEKGWNVS